MSRYWIAHNDSAREVEGRVVVPGVFALRRSDWHPGSWVVDHLPTGRRAGTFSDARRANRFVRLLLSAKDADWWWAIGPSITAETKRVGTKVWREFEAAEGMKREEM